MGSNSTLFGGVGSEVVERPPPNRAQRRSTAKFFRTHKNIVIKNGKIMKARKK